MNFSKTLSLFSLSFLSLISTSIQLNTNITSCVQGLAIHSLCKSDSACGNYNGYQLVCTVNNNQKKGDTYCNCPAGVDCNTPVVGVGLFGKCGPTTACVLGNGLANGGASSGGCAQPIRCVGNSNFSTTNEPSYYCHTCSSCRQQGIGSKSPDFIFDCAEVCSNAVLNNVTRPIPIPKVKPTPSPRNKTLVNTSSSLGSESTAGSGSLLLPSRKNTSTPLPASSDSSFLQANSIGITAAFTLFISVYLYSLQ